MSIQYRIVENVKRNEKEFRSSIFSSKSHIATMEKHLYIYVRYIQIQDFLHYNWYRFPFSLSIYLICLLRKVIYQMKQLAELVKRENKAVCM